MRQNLVSTLLWLLLAAIAQPVVANPSAEFYLNLQRRGVSAFEAARYQEAVDQLRIAAFGMVDDLPLYSKTQVYLTVAYDQLTQQDRARDAARRVLAAERISRSYAKVVISDPLRRSFEGLAARLLTPSEFAYLTEPARRTTTDSPARTAPAGTPTHSAQERTAQQAAPAPRQAATGQQATPATRQAAATSPPAVSSAPAEKAAAPPPATSSTPPPSSTAAQPRPTASATPADQTAATRQATSTPPPASSRAASTTATPSTPPPSSTAAQPRPTASAPPATAPSSTPPPAQPARAETAPPAARETASASTAINVPAELQAADQFLTTADLMAARRIYRQLLAYPALTHREMIRVAEGLYRSRDFEGTLAAFERIGELQPGEEPYRYYVAVASYETGRHAEARQALMQALPYIQITSDVVRYRSLIEAAAD